MTVIYCTIDPSRNLYMRPDEISNGQGGIIGPTPSSQEAAANVVRAQIDRIYEKDEDVSSSQYLSNDINPYERIHNTHSQPLPEQWEKYHTAWQNYYKNYYQGYYSHHYTKNQSFINSDKNDENYKNSKEEEEIIFDLKQKLIQKVRQSAKKIHKSNHFIPVISGIIVVLIFLLLQYNQLIISNVLAYVSPGSIDPQNIVINPNEITVSSEPRLIIPKINVDVPVVYDIGNDYDSQMEAMTKGVAHFAISGANSHPGQAGNTVIAGHSSNDLFDRGEYKFIFVQLDKLVVGDTVYANYNSKRFTYVVTKKEVVNPDDVDKLVYPTDKPILTLLTCTPLGTSKYRLLVVSEQVSPDPSLAESAPSETSRETENIPGPSGRFFDWLFSSRW